VEEGSSTDTHTWKEERERGKRRKTQHEKTVHVSIELIGII
jgi:hypothetical protein